MAKLTMICMDCGKKQGTYNEPSQDVDMTSHVLCEKCAEKRRRELDAYKAGKR